MQAHQNLKESHAMHVNLGSAGTLPTAARQSKLELGDLVLSYLRQLGVEYVFGIPGGAIEPLYNALARSEASGGPRSVLARHETGAAFMADGYSRNSGRLGVCCATTGPGATNLITGVASAYANNTPMLVITAQTPLSTFGRGAFQESSCTGVNTLALFESCTRYNTLVSHSNQLEVKLASAIMTAYQSPSGPVHLSIPLDVLGQPSPVTKPSFNLVELINRPSLIDDEAVKRCYKLLKAASKPVFLIGDEASEAIGSILTVAVSMNIPVLTTPHGKGLVSPYHPLFMGVVGFAGHRSARDILADPEVDTVFAIGASLGEWATESWDTQLVLNERLVHVESTETHFNRSPMARLHVRGRLSTIFDYILGKLKSEASTKLVGESSERIKAQQDQLQLNEEVAFTLDEKDKYESDSVPIKPQRLMRELPRLLPPNTHYLADTGASFAWATHYLHPFDRRLVGRRDGAGGVFRACLEFASMGWAIGSAVGTALALPGQPVVCITGDGSLLMSGQEITVAVQEKLPIIFIVLNDSALGMVKHGQRLTGAAEVGTELPPADLALLAQALGANGYVIHSAADLHDLDFSALIKSTRPTLLDVRIDVDEVPPIGMRTQALKNQR
jgi:acetolactate synthase-1/2/3 large subunit